MWLKICTLSDHQISYLWFTDFLSVSVTLLAIVDVAGGPMASTGAASTGAPSGGPPTNAPDTGTSFDDPQTKPKPTRSKWSIFSGSSATKKPSVVASKLVAKGDIDEALEIIEDALRDIDAVENDAPVLDDDRASLHALAAMCHSQNESMRRACEHFDAALDAAEDEEATTGRRAVAKGPKGPIDAEFFYRMGEACHRRNMHGRCAAAYDEAMEMDPKRKKLPSRLTPSMVHHQAGVSCRECKRYEEALEHFTAVDRPLEAAVGHGDVLCDMERCHTAMGDFASADECVRKATEESKPVRPENVCRVAVCRYERCGGDPRRAVKELSGVVEHKDKTALSKKKEAEVLAMLARLHAGLGELPESEARFEQSLGKAPSSYPTWTSLGQLYEATGRDELALRAYARVVDICDEDEDGGDKNDVDANAPSSNESNNEDEYVAEERRKRREARAEAVILSGAVYERHGQPHRALKSYELLTDAHEETKAAKEIAILTGCALRVQRVFRGNKAREEARRRAIARSVSRHYGARGALKGGDGRGGGVLSESTRGSYVQRWDAAPLAKQAANHPFFKTEGARRKPPGSSFF